MHAIETESDERELAEKRSRRTSPARRDASQTQAPVASRSLALRLRAFRSSVWAPLLLKAVGICGGMLALAAIGASSLARGSGVGVTAAPARASAGMAAAMAPLPAPVPERPREQPSTPPAAAMDSDASADAGAPSPALTSDGKVILNLAGASELRRLPGVGAKRAEAILALRAKLGGRFKRVSDLLRVKGIGQKGIKKIEAMAVLDPPKPSS